MAVCCIANFCSLPSLSFGQALGKLQGKVVTHSEEVGWWRTFDFIVHMGLQIEQALGIYYTYQIVINLYLKSHTQADKPRHSKSY